MRLSDVLRNQSALCEALELCGAQHIAVCHHRLEDPKLSDDETRMERARIAVWRDLLKQITKAKEAEHAGRRSQPRN